MAATNDFRFNWNLPTEQETIQRMIDGAAQEAAPEVTHFPTTDYTQPDVSHLGTTDTTFAVIEQEMEQNRQKISALKQELAQLQQEVGNDDDLDRALAANRARIGDMGNSVAHQQRIDTRKALEANRIETRKAIEANKSREQEFNREELESKLNSIRLQKSWSSGATFAELENQEKELVKKIETLGGTVPESASASATDTKQVMARAAELVQKNGSYTNADKDILRNLIYDVPNWRNDEQLTTLLNSLNNDLSSEDIKKMGSDAAKKLQDAADEISDEDVIMNFGRTVTNGNYEFEVKDNNGKISLYYNGKVVRTLGGK